MSGRTVAHTAEMTAIAPRLAATRIRRDTNCRLPNAFMAATSSGQGDKNTIYTPPAGAYQDIH
jgi:hypothetical protein